MKDPMISVVSASWNQGRYLEDCINSLKRVEDGLLEHIVIDNCSDDETHAVLEKHPNIKTVIEPDSGQSNALNKGIQMARGEWILWLNVDDFLLPGALQRLVDCLQRDGGEFDMLYGHMVFVDGMGGKIRTIYQPRWSFPMTLYGSYAAPSTGSVFRSSFLKNDPLNEEFHMIMDTEWMLRVGERLRTRRLNEEIVAFRVADNKTAEHIGTGQLTPRHQKEREIIAQIHPTYGLRNETSKGRVFHFFVSIRRKFIRARILADKLICKWTARSRTT